jgi:alkylation response protein AidB-like acyl-CoA dehydrogenase
VRRPALHHPPTVAFGLQPITSRGADMVGAAERFAAEFSDGALEHDRGATFAAEHLEKLRADRFLVAPIPEELGGGGVESVHDVLVAAARLAGGDPATAIGVNMHFAIVLNIVRAWRIALSRGAGSQASAVARMLRDVVDTDIVFASAVSEPAPQDLTRPRTTARRNGDGWVVDGRKVFATMAPSATIINAAVTVVADDGGERYGFALVPAAAPGVVFHDDWDAVGMRASDSGSVSFDGVRIGADAVRDGFPVGAFSTALFDRFLASGAFHASASLGVAESAHRRIVATLSTRRDAVGDDPHAMTCLADNVVDLTAMQASLDAAGRRIDVYRAAFPRGEATEEEAQQITADVQASKAFICAAAQRVTDRALALSGGAGYMATHPLAKAWRDARAGAFMHPFGANRAFDLVARTALGLEVRHEPGAATRTGGDTTAHVEEGTSTTQRASR